MLDLRLLISADTTKPITNAACRRLQARTRGSDAPPARSASEDGRGGAAAPNRGVRSPRPLIVQEGPNLVRIDGTNGRISKVGSEPTASNTTRFSPSVGRLGRIEPNFQDRGEGASPLQKCSVL